MKNLTAQNFISSTKQWSNSAYIGCVHLKIALIVYEKKNRIAMYTIKQLLDANLGTTIIRILPNIIRKMIRGSQTWQGHFIKAAVSDY